MPTLDLRLPTSWSDLTDDQLLFVFRLMATDLSGTAIASRCLLHWNDLHVLTTVGEMSVLRRGTNRFLLSSLQLAESIQSLSWLGDIPYRPIRISQLPKNGKLRHSTYVAALPADFAAVPFEQFLICDNLYQGYLQTKSKELLVQMASILYPGFHASKKASNKYSVLRPITINVFYWFTSLKSFFGREFPNFFHPAANALGPAVPTRQQLQAAMNTQIRALTKGDITKEKEVLAMDTLRALTELDAQAREYDEIHKKTK